MPDNIASDFAAAFSHEFGGVWHAVRNDAAITGSFTQSDALKLMAFFNRAFIPFKHHRNGDNVMLTVTDKFQDTLDFAAAICGRTQDPTQTTTIKNILARMSANDTTNHLYTRR
jgi:hypothetical protein